MTMGEESATPAIAGRRRPPPRRSSEANVGDATPKSVWRRPPVMRSSFNDKKAADMLFRGRHATEGELEVPGIDEYVTMPGSLFRRLVFFMLIYSCLMNFVEICFVAALYRDEECGVMIQADTTAKCRARPLWVICRGVEYVKYFVCYLICCAYFMYKLFNVVKLQYYAMRGVIYDQKPGLWGCAGSRDIFLETAASVSGAHRQSALFIGFSVVVTSSTMLAANLQSPGLTEWSDQLCGVGELNLCRCSIMSAAALPNFNIGILMWILAVFVFTPLSFWNQVQQDALVATGNTRLKKLLVLHWIMMPATFANLALFLYQCLVVRTFSATRSGMVAFFIGNICISVYSLVVLVTVLWSSTTTDAEDDEWDEEQGTSPAQISVPLDPKFDKDYGEDGSEVLGNSFGLSDSLFSLLRKTKKFGSGKSWKSLDSAQSLTISSGDDGCVPGNMDYARSRQSSSKSFASSEGQQHQDGMRTSWLHRLGIGSREGGCRLEQTVLAMTAVNLFCISHMAASVTHVIILWILRIVYITLLVSSRDPVASFKDLESGAGLGLVVDARQLCRAIDAYLRGAGASPNPVSFYKGSYLRMKDTMAVSYRWQSWAVQLSPNLTINMSQWQLSMLKQAILNSNAKYVWLDKCSVIQTPGVLQRTLLSRMMAVYACAGTTLAIRSSEKERSRYHQRAWTVQEFCIAPSLRMVSEEASGNPEDSSPKFAVKEQEDLVSRRLRKEAVKFSQAVRPYWLYGYFVVDDAQNAREVWHKYKALSEVVFCLHECDKIRALYPLLCRTTVETQLELVELVENISAHNHGELPKGYQELKLERQDSADMTIGWRGYRSARRTSDGSPSRGISDDGIAERSSASYSTLIQRMQLPLTGMSERLMQMPIPPPSQEGFEKSALSSGPSGKRLLEGGSSGKRLLVGGSSGKRLLIGGSSGKRAMRHSDCSQGRVTDTDIPNVVIERRRSMPVASATFPQKRPTVTRDDSSLCLKSRVNLRYSNSNKPMIEIPAAFQGSPLNTPSPGHKVPLATLAEVSSRFYDDQ